MAVRKAQESYGLTPATRTRHDRADPIFDPEEAIFSRDEWGAAIGGRARGPQ